MKRWIVAALVLALGLMLAGCARGKVDAGQIADAEMDNKMFMVVSDENTGEVIVDKSTRVMYWISKYSNNSGNMTLLVNPDGTPRIWEG
jgi:type IV pilus biogenesis protein CpaD/CtpE